MPLTALTGPGFAFALLTKSAFESDRVWTVSVTAFGVEYVQLWYRPSLWSLPGPTAPRTAVASARVTSLHGFGAAAPAPEAAEAATAAVPATAQRTGTINRRR